MSRIRNMMNMKRFFVIALIAAMLATPAGSYSYAAADKDSRETDQPSGVERYYQDDQDGYMPAAPDEQKEEEEQGAVFREHEGSENVHVDGLRSKMEKPELVDTEEEIPADRKVDAIIILDERSLLERGYEASEIPESFWAGVTADAMNRKQDRIVDKAEDICSSVEVRYYYTIGMCGIGIRTEYRNIERLKGIRGVKDVILSTVYSVPPADDTNRINGAEAAWNESGYTGKGSKIAVIDTGLDLTHPSFQGGEGFAVTEDSLTPAKIDNVLDGLNASARMSGLTSGKLYMSSKVPFAFNYIDSSLRVDHEDANGSDHGTHVAGIAAGNRLKETSICGVAPDAQIMVMKVFGNRGGAYFSDIMAAMEDAVMLEADSINISVGSPAGFTEDEDTVNSIFSRICNTDIVVAAAAGNEYNAAYGNPSGTDANLTSNPDNGIVSSPGSYLSSTTVASIDNAAEYFTAGGRNFSFNDSAKTDDTKFMKNFAQGQTYSFAPVDNFGADVADFEKAGVRGRIALVSRGGEVPFMTKQSNAQAAGALGVLVYNNTEGKTAMKINDGKGHIPCISISRSAGQFMADLYKKGDDKLTIGTGKIKDNIGLSDFSSWGCTPSLNLKPDITAVGGNVLSAVNGGGYGTKTGTSMASPQVAGTSALIKQYLRDKEPGLSGAAVYERINQLLMSTAVPYKAENAVEFSPRKQGAGVINAGDALKTDAFLSVDTQKDRRPKAELFDDPSKKGDYSFTYKVTNTTGDSLAYSMSNSALTNDYTVKTDKDGKEFYLMSERSKKLDTKTTLSSSDIGYYYDDNDDGAVDTRDIRKLLIKDTYSNREQAMADINGDGVYCSGSDAQLFLDNMTGLDSTVDLKEKTLIVPADGSSEVNVNIKLTDAEKKELDRYYPNGIYVEGFSYLNSRNGDRISLSLPYMGFYGDWTAAPAFDAEDHFYQTEGKVNSYGTYLWTDESIIGVNPYIETEYDPAHNAISDVNTLDVFETGLLRNVKQMDYIVRDDKNSVLYDHSERYVAKSLLRSGSNTYKVYRSPRLWDGTDRSGDFLANGSKVELEVKATFDYKGKTQSRKYPITVDTEKPELLKTETVQENGKIKLKASFRDNHYISAVIFKSANGSMELDRYNVDQKTAGETITDMEFDVTEYDDDFMMIICDYAMNQSDYDIDMGVKDNSLRPPAPLGKDKIYGFNMGEATSIGDGMVEADKKDASGAHIIADVSGLEAAEYIDGYVIGVNALREVNVYAPQGRVWQQKKLSDISCDVYDMAFSHKDGKLYAITFRDNKAYLSTIGIYDGKVTEIAPFGQTMVTMGCTTEGELYTLSKKGELYRIDPSDASGTLIGKVSETESPDWVTLNYRQSMGYDHNDKVMYWYAFSANRDTNKIISYLAKIDLKTGKTEKVGEFAKGCEVTGLFIPYPGNLNVKPTDKVTGITLNESSVALYPGQEVRVFAAVTPWNTNKNDVEWYSDDENIAAVRNGRINATGSGETVIHARVKGTDFTASCSVKILPEPDPFYGYLLTDWHGDPGNSIIRFNASDPIKYKRMTDLSEFVYAGEYVDGYYYCYDSNGYLYKVDPEKWDYSLVGKADGRMVEMTYDYADNMMYGLLSNGHQTTLVNVDINTGETVPVGPQDTKVVAMASVPDSPMDAEGKFASATLYGINEKSQLVTIDKKDGHDRVDPASGSYEIPPVSYVQSMTYDYNTGYLYWAQAYKPQSSSLYVLDLENHAKYYAGVIGRVGSQVSGLCTIPQKGKVPEIPYTELKDINIDSADRVLVKGSKLKIKVRTVPANATSRSFEWSTDAPDIADVNSGGEVTANNTGTAVIKCKVRDGSRTIEKSVKVTVIEPAGDLNGFLMLDNYDNSQKAWIGIDPVAPQDYEVKYKSKAQISAGTYHDGYIYGYDNDNETVSGQRNFYRIDEKTGHAEKLGSITNDVTDMTFDYSTGITYAIADGTDISIVDPSSGDLETVLSQKDKIFVTIAADKNGKIYTIARDADSKTGDSALYTVDISSGKITKVGDTGQRAVLEQSMIFDHETGYIYWAQISGSRDAKLYIVDPASGYATPAGTIGKAGSEVSALYSTVNEPEAPYVPLKGISIKQGSNAVLASGSELRLNVSADPVYATDRDFEFSSDNEKTAKVSADGTVTGGEPGTAVITVRVKKFGKDITGSIKVKVIAPPEKMEAFLIRDNFDEQNSNRFIRFSMNDSEVYETVKQFDKTIEAADRYDGYIYAFTKDSQFLKIDEKTKDYTVISNVKERMDDLAFSPAKGVMYGKTYLGYQIVQVDLRNGNIHSLGDVRDKDGRSVRIKTLAADEKGNLYGMTSGGNLYSIDDNAVASLITETGLTIRSGHECDLSYDPDTKMLYYAQSSDIEQKLYMIDPDSKAVIEMYPVGPSGCQLSLLYADSSTKVKVPETVDAESVRLSNEVAELAAGGTVKLAATVFPVSVRVSQDVTWRSEDPSVAEVAADGTVTGKAAGETYVIAESKDGKASARCKVSVGGSRMYGYSYSHKAWVSFSPDDPQTLTELAKGDEVADAVNVNGTVYAYLKGGKQLVRFDFANKDFTYHKIGGASGRSIRSLAYDPTRGKLYGISMNKMFEIDMNTGVNKQLSSKYYFGKPGMMLYTMACSSNGDIYALSSFGTLCTLDQTTGLGEYVKNQKIYPADGPGTNLNGSYNPMVFGDDGTLYWGATTRKDMYSTTLKTIDLGTALTKQTIGKFGGGKVKMCAVFFE